MGGDKGFVPHSHLLLHKVEAKMLLAVVPVIEFFTLKCNNYPNFIIALSCCGAVFKELT
jgi:hypothetical protein